LISTPRPIGSYIESTSKLNTISPTNGNGPSNKLELQYPSSIQDTISIVLDKIGLLKPLMPTPLDLFKDPLVLDLNLPFIPTIFTLHKKPIIFARLAHRLSTSTPRETMVFLEEAIGLSLTFMSIT
jgi:hypothetical protein